MKKIAFLMVLALSVVALSVSAQLPPSEQFDVRITLQQGVRTLITSLQDTNLFVTYQGLTSVVDPRSGATTTIASYLIEGAGADGTVYSSQVQSTTPDNLASQPFGSYFAFSAQQGYWTIFRDGALTQLSPATASSAEIRIVGGKAFLLPAASGKVVAGQEFERSVIVDAINSVFFPPSAPITLNVEIHRMNPDRTTTIIGSRTFTGTADTLPGAFALERETFALSETLSSQYEYLVRVSGEATYNGQSRTARSDSTFRVFGFNLIVQSSEFTTGRVSATFNAPLASVTSHTLSVIGGRQLDVEASFDAQPSRVYPSVGSFFIRYNGRNFDIDVGGLRFGASTVDMKFKQNGALVPIDAVFDGRSYSGFAALNARINARGESEFTLLDASNRAIAVVIARDVFADFTTITSVPSTASVDASGSLIVVPQTQLAAGTTARLDYAVVADNGAAASGYILGTVQTQDNSMQVTGTVMLDGQPYTGPVSAYIGTVGCDEFTSGNGAFSGRVLSADQRAGCGTDGATVTFMLGGQFKADQTLVFVSGGQASIALVVNTNPFLNGGTLHIEGTKGPYATSFAGFMIQSVSSPDTTIMVRTPGGNNGNNMFIDNLGPNSVVVQLNKNGVVVDIPISSGGSLKIIGPNSPVKDLLIVPLTGGISITGTSGEDKIFPVTVQKSLVGSAGVSREIAPINGYLQDGTGQVTLQSFGETRTASFDVFIADGKDFTKFKPNAAVIAPEQRQIVLEDESAGEACAPATLKYSTDFASPLVSKMFVTNTKNGQWTCSSGRAVGGSLLQVFDPDVLETNSEAVFIYETADTSWDVTATVIPPEGCVVDETVKSTSVSQETEALLFSIACPVETTGAMITGAVPGLNGKALGVSHKVVDKTKDSQGKQKNKASTLSRSIAVMERGSGKFAGQGALTTSLNGDGMPQPAALLLLAIAVGALYYLAVRKK